MPKTPTKAWMKRCTSSLKKAKKTKTPAKLCGWIWYHQMSKKAKKAAYQEELKSKRKNKSYMSKETKYIWQEYTPQEIEAGKDYYLRQGNRIRWDSIDDNSKRYYIREALYGRAYRSSSKKRSSVESKLGLTKKSPKRISVRVCRKYDLSIPLESIYSAASRHHHAEWTGRAPSSCEICKSKIEKDFIDGKTKIGPWALMCKSCHEKHGVGLGIGRGQKYEIKKEDKRSRNISKYSANPARRSTSAEYKKLKILMTPKHVDKRRKKIKVKYSSNFDPSAQYLINTVSRATRSRYDAKIPGYGTVTIPALHERRYKVLSTGDILSFSQLSKSQRDWATGEGDDLSRKDIIDLHL